MVSCLIVASLLAASCAAPVEEEVKEEEEEEWVTEIEEVEEVEEVALIASAEPVYGGTITISTDAPGQFDPGGIGGGQSDVKSAVMESQGMGDWAKGPQGTGECQWLTPSFDVLQCGVGKIIESYEQTGPLTYVGHVRPGIKFNAALPHMKDLVQDREITAEDIFYSWDRAMNMPGARVTMAEYIESITVVDRYTIEYVMSKPYYNAVGGLFWGRTVYPREVIDEYGEITDWRNMVGSGPWILSDFVTDVAATFSKNPDYWGYDELHPEYRLPYADSYKQLFIVDRMTALSALRTGKIDILWRVIPDEAGTIEVSNPELQRRQAIQDDSRPKFHIMMDKPPFDDIRVRQALSMSIDRQDLVDSYYGGLGEPFNDVCSPFWTNWFVPLEELPEDIAEIYSYNPEKARELLDEALGPGVELEFPVNCLADMVDQVIVMQSYWNDVGLNAIVNVMEGGTLRSMMKPVGTYEGIAAHNSGMQPPYNEAMWPKDFYPGENWEDPIWEAMHEEMLGTTDPDEQWTLYEQARNHQLRQVPHFRFPHPYIYTYWQPWLGGYAGEFSVGNWPGLYARLWVDQTVKRAMGR